MSKLNIITEKLDWIQQIWEVNNLSDVDIFVKMDKQDLFSLIGIKQNLEDILQLPVDVVSYRKEMNIFLKKRIDKEAIYV